MKDSSGVLWGFHFAVEVLQTSCVPQLEEAERVKNAWIKHGLGLIERVKNAWIKHGLGRALGHTNFQGMHDNVGMPAWRQTLTHKLP